LHLGSPKKSTLQAKIPSASPGYSFSFVEVNTEPDAVPLALWEEHGWISSLVPPDVSDIQSGAAWVCQFLAFAGRI